MQHFSAERILLGGQVLGQRPLQPGEFLVAFGQCADRDQRLAQVLVDLPFRQCVERVVGERHATGGEVGQHRDDGLFGEPAVRGDRVFGGGDVVSQGQQPRGKFGRGGAHESSRRRLIRQRTHWPGFGWSGSPQVGQSSQDAGGAQSAQSGRLRVPPAIADRDRNPSRSPIGADRAAPRSTRGAGDTASGGVAADGAGQHR